MAQGKRSPQRTCAACGEVKNKSDLVRIVRTPEGEILMDDTGRKNGRGTYICRNPECLEKARKKKSLDRSLRTTVPEEVYSRLKEAFSDIETG